ncbi:MAG: hypothetical protein ABH864_02940 [archaeon]
MLKRFMSIFGKKEEVKKAPAVKKRAASSGHLKKINSLKSEVEKMQEQSSGLNAELAKIKNHVSSIPNHGEVIESFHKKHESHERKLETHSEKFGHFDSKLQDQRIDIVELKSRLRELGGSVARFESLFAKVDELDKRTLSADVVRAERVATKVAKATAPTGSLVEQYHSMAPSTKKIFSLLLQMHVGNKGKWVALSNLRDAVYPEGGNSNSTKAAMAKAIRPLYENGFVEKKRDKSFVNVAATKRGREAAKEVGLEQQAEKFDAAFAKLE